MTKIVLISTTFSGKDTERSGTNLGVQYLKAALECNGNNAEIWEYGIHFESPEELAEKAIESSVRLLGFGVLFSEHLYNVVNFVRDLRDCLGDANVVIGMGGQGTSFLWKDILECCAALDFVCCFEGEQTLCEIATAIEEENDFSSIQGIWQRDRSSIIQFNGFREPTVELDDLPFPARDTPDSGAVNFAKVLSSRGCTARCLFCCSGSFGNRYHSAKSWRPRSVANLFDELQSLVSNGCQAISFVDDDFLGACEEGKQRGWLFADRLAKSSMDIAWSMECRVDEVESNLFERFVINGLRHVLLGIDALNLHDLKIYGKGFKLEEIYNAVDILHALRVPIECGLIMFHPRTTIKSVEENLHRLIELEVGGVDSICNKLIVYKRSPLVRMYEKSRELHFDETKFHYVYEFENHDVAELRETFVNSLIPFRAVERRLDGTIYEYGCSLRSAAPLHDDCWARLLQFRRKKNVAVAKICLALLSETSEKSVDSIVDLAGRICEDLDIELDRIG